LTITKPNPESQAPTHPSPDSPDTDAQAHTTHEHSSSARKQNNTENARKNHHITHCQPPSKDHHQPTPHLPRCSTKKKFPSTHQAHTAQTPEQSYFHTSPDSCRSIPIQLLKAPEKRLHSNHPLHTCSHCQDPCKHPSLTTTSKKKKERKIIPTCLCLLDLPRQQQGHGETSSSAFSHRLTPGCPIACAGSAKH